MKTFVKEWWLQIVLLVVIVIGIGIVQTQAVWAPRVYGEYVLFRLRNDGLSIVPQPQTLSAAVASGEKQSIGSISFNLPWTISTNTRMSTTTALWLTNADNNKLIVFSRGKNSYNMYAQMLATTPSDVKFFGSTDSFSSTVATLARKKEVLFGMAPIYSFETNNGVRGFMSPVSATSSAAVLFAPDGSEYEFAFGNLSGEQIDQALQSIKEAK